jgi:tetratricopeptide (TPR) repeat protein
VIEDLAGSAAQGRWPEHATIGRYWIETHRDPAFDLDAACSRVEAMIPVLEEAGDYLGLARAWSFLAERYLMQAQWQAMEEPLTRAIHHARRAGARRYEIRAVRRLANCAYWGPTLAASGVERCWSLLAQYRDNLSLESGIHAACGILEAQQGHWDEARSLLSRSNETLENLGNLVAVAGNRGFFSGPLEVLAGDLPAAERHLRFAQDELERVGEAAWRSTIAGYLADVVYRQGRFDEAESWAEIARLLSAPQDAVSQALWRSVRARVLARRGQFEDAEEVARDAVRTMEGTDQLDLRGDVCMARAEVLALAGRPAEARSTLAEAVRLYKAKGNIVSAGRAREAMADLAV